MDFNCFPSTLRAEPPDDVSITISDMSTKEGSKIKLMCSIRNVAPADRLNVTWTWQRGNETVDPGTAFF